MTDNLSLATSSTEVLEHEATTLAAQIALATCRFLVVIGELDAREAWGSWGCKSMAHWVSWRCSMSPITAREHVRVARALRTLPSMVAAFERGELTFSKVRALTRVATPESEADLVELGRTATAAQLEKIIRASVAAMTDPDKQDALRELHTGCRYDGMGEVKAVLRVEELSLVESAIAAAMPATNASAEAPIAARRVDALVRICQTYLAGDGEVVGEAPGVSMVVHVEADPDTGEISSAETEDGRPVHPEIAAKLACDATLYTIVHGRLEPLGQGRTTREPSRAMRRAIRRRSGGRCEWVGCNDKAHLQLHHIVWWSQNGPTEWWNLAALCWFHHHLVHKKGWRIEFDRDTTTMHCYRPDGTELIGPTPPIDLTPFESDIGDDERVVPLWAGEPFDLSACVDAVLDAGRRRTA